MGIGTDTDIGTDVGVIDNMYGCWYRRNYRRSKDTYGP